VLRCNGINKSLRQKRNTNQKNKKQTKQQQKTKKCSLQIKNKYLP
jgi:hypothetical protein